MKISGNQTAIVEIFNLLDENFKYFEFVCKCPYSGMSENYLGCHYCICQYQNKLSEKTLGCQYYVFDVDYDGEKIKSVKKLHHGYSNGNILDGCVK